MISNLFAPLAMKVAGAIIAALLIALALVTWRADQISDDRERLRGTLASEEARHEITRTSLATLEDELTAMVRDGQLRASRLEQARQEQAAATEALREQADRIRAEAAADGDPCVTPRAVRDARGL